MKSIIDIFSKPPEMYVADIQKKKGHYLDLLGYYTQKIEFLSQKNMDAYLLELGTQDVPIVTKGRIKEIGNGKYLKNCLKYYQKKLSSVKSELKQIDKIKIKQFIL